MSSFRDGFNIEQLAGIVLYSTKQDHRNAVAMLLDCLENIRRPQNKFAFPWGQLDEGIFRIVSR